MSRVGLEPIKIPEGVSVEIENKKYGGGQIVTVKGPLGELKQELKRLQEYYRDDTVPPWDSGS